MGIILLIVLVILLFGSLPTYSYSRNWGYRPAGGLGLVLVVILVLLLFGVFPWGFGPTPVRGPVVP
jgi:hypothetical protein